MMMIMMVATVEVMEMGSPLMVAALIRLQCIYNFLLFHAIIVSILDVFLYIYSNYISFFLD